MHRGLLFVSFLALPAITGLTACDRAEAPAQAVQPAASIDQLIAASPRLDAKQRAVVDATNAHVLLLTDDKRLEASFLTGGADWYTASVGLKDITIVIEGKTTPKDHPEITAEFPKTPPSLAKPRIARNELIVEAAFIHGRTSFSVEVECALPSRDPRCTEDAFIRKLLTELEHVPATNGPKAAVPKTAGPAQSSVEGG